MKMCMFSLYDTVSEEFGAPFLQKNEKLAKLALSKFLENKKELTVEDFVLWKIGVFDTEKGCILDTTKECINIDDLKDKEDGKDSV